MRYAFAAPILPGQTGACRRFIADLAGKRQEEYVDLQQRTGVTEETYWLQEGGPQGDVLIVVSDNDQQVFNALMANPQTEFDRWFGAQIQTIFGLDPATLSDFPPPPEPMLEWRA